MEARGPGSISQREMMVFQTKGGGENGFKGISDGVCGQAAWGCE